MPYRYLLQTTQPVTENLPPWAKYTTAIVVALIAILTLVSASLIPVIFLILGQIKKGWAELRAQGAATNEKAKAALQNSQTTSDRVTTVARALGDVQQNVTAIAAASPAPIALHNTLPSQTSDH